EDGVAKGLSAAVTAALDLFACELHQPAFDEIQPGGTGGGEVQVEARMPEQPPLDGRRFVGGVVVEDEMQVQVRRHRRLDAVQKLTKLLGTMPRVAGPDDGAGFYVQRGEER